MYVISPRRLFALLFLFFTHLRIGSEALLHAMDRVRATTRTNEAVAKYGATGKGVTVVIMDRGVDWRHPDFIKPDGTTRIKWILDMSGQSGCSAGNPQPVEYTQAQINAALAGGPAINHRDAVGHGTITAGLAAGNGRAFAGGKYHGMAPEADLVIVKLTSDGAPAHDSQPAEDAFVACIFDALTWVEEKMNLLGQPTVAIANMGVQWGPLDGTSSESRRIDEVFGLDRRGRIYATGSGDEGGLPTHSGGSYNSAGDAVVQLNKAAAEAADIFAWYTGALPAQITLTFDDGTVIGPVAPGVFGLSQNGVTVWHYQPGEDPWQSTSGDRLVFFRINGHAGNGSFRIQGLQPGTGRFDLYTPIQSSIKFLDQLAPGRLNQFAVTESAVVAGVEVARTSYVDLDGVPRDTSSEGATGDLWIGSADGPSRDGRLGVDVAVPSHTSFAAYATGSWWRTFRHNVIQDGGGWYGAGGAASASGPVLAGAIGLMLQLDPKLTARQIKEILHSTAITDSFTGAVPNAEWGYGKLNMLKLMDKVFALKQQRVKVDFDGDGKSDVAIYRDGLWPILRSSDGKIIVEGLGAASHIPVPADYDGDGRADVAVYVASTGVWSIKRSSDVVTTTTGFGGPPFTPVPADYDGDGKADVAVYSNGVWSILRSTDGGNTIAAHGGPGWLPVPADYDGDGKADIAVYINGAWSIVRSSDGGNTVIAHGGPLWTPVPADYDGDGRADAAVHLAGAWSVVRTSDGGNTVAGHGGPAWEPVPADYDGDGKTDISVHMSGAWSIVRSSDGGFTVVGHGGGATDVPLN